MNKEHRKMLFDSLPLRFFTDQELRKNVKIGTIEPEIVLRQKY